MGKEKVVSVRTYKLDGDLLVVEQIDTLKNDAERTLADLPSDAVVDADNVG